MYPLDYQNGLIKLLLLPVLFLAACSSTEVADKIPEEGLVAYYDFEDGEAGDVSGNGHNGSVFGASVAPGIIGDALRFDGEDDFVLITDDGSFSLIEKTVHFWFYKSDDAIENAPSYVDVEGLIYKSLDTGPRRDLSVVIREVSPPFTIALRTGNGSETFTTDEETFVKAGAKNKILPRRWYHVVATFSPSEVALSVNGERIAASRFEGTIELNGAPIVLGKASVESAPQRYFNGLIDELRIYDRVLSEEEITILYDQGAEQMN